MKIKLYGSLRQAAGKTELDASGVTVRQVLEHICKENQLLRAAILDGDALRPHVRVMVNGHDIELAQGMDTVVSDRDQVAIFPPIAGG